MNDPNTGTTTSQAWVVAVCLLFDSFRSLNSKFLATSQVDDTKLANFVSRKFTYYSKIADLEKGIKKAGCRGGPKRCW